MQYQVLNNWRRERNWIPTFSRRIANDFAALRFNSPQGAERISQCVIRESPSTSDSRGFEGSLSTAAQQCFPHREGPPARRGSCPPPKNAAASRGGCPSQTFPPAPSPAPGDGIGPEVMAEVEKIAAWFMREGIVHSRSKKDLWAARPMAFTKQRSAMPTWRARKRRTRCCLPPSAGRNGMPSLMKSAPRRVFCGFARANIPDLTSHANLSIGYNP
jgi:hypothetical protein